MSLLAETIRHYRKESGMSAAALSRKIGKSSSYVAKVEQGKIEPSLRSFARIAVALKFRDIEIGWLVRLTAVEEGTE